jgi:cytochrome c biogenesis protein CcmG, thiol:disulfide interchange protein DsbE
MQELRIKFVLKIESLMNKNIALMLWVFFAMCVVSMLAAQEGTDAQRLLEDTARKYQDIGSYESSAVARRALDGGLTLQVKLRFAYAAPKMTPPELPVPMLPQTVLVQFLGVFDQQDRPVSTSRSFAAPGPVFSFDEIAYRVTSARIVAIETVNTHICKVVEVKYEGGLHRKWKDEVVRYWIEPATNTIWKMQFSEPDPLSKTDEIVRWTVVWDSWDEDHAPPVWLVEAGKKTSGTERTALIGQSAPEVREQSPTGGPFQLSKLKGSIVVLDFWATWCGPCAEEMASLERLKVSLSGKQVEVWSVTEDNPETAKRWLAERNRTLPTAIIAPDTAFQSYNIESIPQVVIIDRMGVVAHQWAGLQNEKHLRQAIDALLAQ